MTEDIAPATSNDDVDPDILQILAPLVDLAGAIDSAETLLSHAATFYGAAQMARDLHEAFQPRRKKYKKAIIGIRAGIVRTQAGLQSLSAMSELANLQVSKRRNGFLLKAGSFHPYQHTIREMHAGLASVRKNTDTLRDLHAGIPEFAKAEYLLSAKAAALVDALGNALKALAAISKDAEARDEPLRQLLERASTFCREALIHVDTLESGLFGDD